MRTKIGVIMFFVLVILMTAAATLPPNIVSLKPGQTRQVICQDGQTAYVLDSDAFGLVVGCPQEKENK